MHKHLRKHQMHASIVHNDNIENYQKFPRRKICVEFYCQSYLRRQCQSHLPLATGECLRLI